MGVERGGKEGKMSPMIDMNHFGGEFPEYPKGRGGGGGGGGGGKCRRRRKICVLTQEHRQQRATPLQISRGEGG